MSPIISGIIGGLIATILVGYFVKRIKSIHTDEKLYMSNFVLVLGICCLTISLGMVWILFFTNHGGQEIPI